MRRGPRGNEKIPTGGAPSLKHHRSGITERNRYSGITPEKKTQTLHMHDRRFDLVLDGVPYFIRSIPFLFNDEWRFRISINGEMEHLFTWDYSSNMLRAIDHDSSTLPAGLEEAVSNKLRSR